MKKNKAFIAIFILCVLLVCTYYFIFTTPGSEYLAARMMAKHIEYENLVYKNIKGNLADGLTYENLEINDIKHLPEGTVLRIQRLFLNLTSWNLDGIYVEVENARLRLPDSNPLVIAGTFKERKLNLNIFSAGFRVNDVKSYLPDFKDLFPIKGDVMGVDLYISGNYLEPHVKGALTLEEFIYPAFKLNGVVLDFDLDIKDITDEIKLNGEVHSNDGELSTKRVLVKLEDGNLNYTGLWDQPVIHLKGSSKVEKTKINITLKGTVEKPDLILSSEPPYSSQKLMVMLATGKSWQSVENSIDNGINSAAITKDFIDYFFFAGKSNQFAKKFGISEFAVTFDQNHKGVSAKKEITEKLQVGYGVEQKKTNGQVSDVSQKLEGEYKVTDRISVGVERESKKTQIVDTLNERETENNDKVMIKYKKSF